MGDGGSGGGVHGSGPPCGDRIDFGTAPTRQRGRPGCRRAARSRRCHGIGMHKDVIGTSHDGDQLFAGVVTMRRQLGGELGYQRYGHQADIGVGGDVRLQGHRIGAKRQLHARAALGIVGAIGVGYHRHQGNLRNVGQQARLGRARCRHIDLPRQQFGPVDRAGGGAIDCPLATAYGGNGAHLVSAHIAEAVAKGHQRGVGDFGGGVATAAAAGSQDQRRRDRSHQQRHF